MLSIKIVTVLIIIGLILNGVETKLEVSMENEIKSVSDIIAEISKKDKKRQVFILTNLINQLKSTMGGNAVLS